ncbi:MAG: hypothetical protein UZ16_OP3001001090 [Candidatus Hinthialibacteria bacterium OLB16]|nr:MAG: hypothetical protein UZ16_OP3001001090 [Candidatus Hinthialibacteria bacterium OLB16]
MEVLGMTMEVSGIDDGGIGNNDAMSGVGDEGSGKGATPPPIGKEGGKCLV